MEFHTAFAHRDTALLELSEADIAGVVEFPLVQKLGRFLLGHPAVRDNGAFFGPSLELNGRIRQKNHHNSEGQCQYDGRQGIHIS